MSNPDINAATKGIPAGSSATQTFEEKVKGAISSMTDVGGKKVFQDGLSEEVKVAANAERRRRDTFRDFTASKQEINTLKAENELLKNNHKLNYSIPQDIEDLKFSDPDAWKIKVDEIESEARLKLQSKITEATTEAQQNAEMENRMTVLQQFMSENPTSKVSEHSLANDLPPRITRKLEDGKLTWDQYLDEADMYLEKSKKIDTGTPVPSQQSLTSAAGGSDIHQDPNKEPTSYKDEVY